MRVSIIGTGYVGLVSGVCLAELGHEVICVDVDKDKVATINSGHTPIYEKGLDDLLEKNLNINFLASDDLHFAVQETEISLIAVGTPYDGKQIDLGYIKQVSYDLGKEIAQKSSYHTVVIKSTVVPGTTDDVVKPIITEVSRKMHGQDFGVGMNPEFLREGEAVFDFLNPDRIVLGASDDKALNALDTLYMPFKDVDIIRTNTKSAEMIKYTSNALLAALISFSNEIGNLCDAIGDIDVKDVLHGVHLDKRISPIQEDGSRIIPALTTYLEAGCGFGGSCFPKDVKALVSHGKKFGQQMQILDAILQVNNKQPLEMIRILQKHFPNLENISVGILGLAFKPGTDDIRESPAITIIDTLSDYGVKVSVYDPIAMEPAKVLFNDLNIVYYDSLQDIVQRVDALLLVTRWEEFKALPELLYNLNDPPLLIDGRRMIIKDSIKNYDGIGLGRL